MTSAIKHDDGSVLLAISTDQAETLRFVTMRIGGSPSLSRRKHMEEIGTALSAAGVTWRDYPTTANRAIYFRDEPEKFTPPFEPGYFKDTGDGEVKWFEDPPRDAPANGKWVRVNVTLADG